MNPLGRPRSPQPPPRALLSSVRTGGRDPAEGDTAPGADAAWNPEQKPGRRLASRVSSLSGWSHFGFLQTLAAARRGVGTPECRQLLCALFS